MKSKLLIPLVILISINCSHCKNSEVVDLGIRPIDRLSASIGKLKSITKRDLEAPENDMTTLFSYDQNGLLNKTYEVNYNGDTLSKYVFHLDEDKLLLSDTTFSYDSEESTKIRSFQYQNDKLDVVTETTLPSNQVLEYHYQYGYDGEVTKIEIQRIFNGSLLTIGKGEFEWKDGNLLALKDNLEIGKYEEFEFQYDEKDNYFNQYIETEFPLFTFDAMFLSKNNLVAMKSNFENKVSKIDVEFDKENKPTLRTISEPVGGQWAAKREEAYTYWE